MIKKLQEAARGGRAKDIEELIGLGADVNAKDRYGQTALMLAANRGYNIVVELLIEHGAELNVTAKYGLSAIMLAVIGGHVHVIRALAEAGADVTLRGTGDAGFYNKTAYDLAADRGDLDDVMDLLKGSAV